MTKKIGYTTGVFDMFHVGHLRILKRAREHCDHLIVGVSTDDLVESYKKKRPIISVEDRMEILSGVKYVDEIVTQTHRDKYKAYQDIGFDVMFVGDDWKGDPLFSELEKKFASDGVEIVYFPYTSSVSSSHLGQVLEDINKREFSV
ncbi:adenylyltransferase/cytidyltransferase family protein [Parasphingorhabdus sp.]|uniref:adenylyltransferase/cytidyltransferase family protein n=1 Tax=Parasphingorhabdus sp. TaxID=2709688 RepID=UPI00326440CF